MILTSRNISIGYVVLFVFTTILISPALSLAAAEQVTNVTITSVAPNNSIWISSLPQSVTINFTCTSDGVQSDVAVVGYIEPNGFQTSQSTASPVTCDGSTNNSGSLSMQSNAQDGYHSGLARVCKDSLGSGNCLQGSSLSQSTKLAVDTSAPNAVGVLSSGSHFAGSWSNKSSISLSWSPASDIGPSGISGYSVQCGSGSVFPDNNVDTSGTSSTANLFEGNNLNCAIKVKDAAGHWSSTTSAGPFKIDLTPPTITGQNSSIPNSKGWYSGPVTIDFSCFDSGSGVQSVSPSSTLSFEGFNQFADGVCVDKATNSASTKISGINIDMTAPQLNILRPSADEIFLLNNSTLAEWTTSDNLSSVSIVSASAASGQHIDTSGVGEKIFSVTIADQADNTTSLEVRYRVQFDVRPSNPSGSFLADPLDEQVQLGSAVVEGRYTVGDSIELRFKLVDSDGNSIENLHPSLSILAVNLNGGNETSTAITKTWQFEYDSATGEYFLILDTEAESLSAGIYDLYINLDDESSHRTRIVIEEPEANPSD
jgi:hypothetical protein